MSGEEPLQHPPITTTDRRITLQVGERRFVTTLQTLQESGFFASLLSGRWDNAQGDGSYFVDADPTLFEHILRYLRRGVLPIFYDKAKGHDYGMYLALLEEAKYLDITRLVDWLEKKQYLHAIKTKVSSKEVEGTDQLCATRESNVDLRWHPTWVTRKVYICPRRIYAHRGDARACGRYCRKAQGDADDIYEDELVLRALVTEKQVIFDGNACVEGR
ncbi:uncharacterized protein EI97DRAFT_496147 [Westerdykella ornata]|uniref:BTB domain-containing protein n=1 Tax=Westerdykella ornata TaxID=318751 RepID=A0A6A6J9F6_WESOR|nr:uncharacterized protein EI97DRAFT_496147 [Westerdykella ornata]KAF2273210.1 hypothetical protein EI97DRAFT_496147 [Westerdykella ornata]